MIEWLHVQSEGIGNIYTFLNIGYTVLGQQQAKF